MRVSVLFVSILALALQSSGVEIIGHRGASFDAPENTLSSFRLGYEQKADGVELDIHLTKDGKIVVMHDYDTGRVGGSTNKIVDSTLAELRSYEIGRWSKWTNAFHEKIPLLSEVLPIIPPGKKLFIEIKTGPEIVPELVEVIKNSNSKPEQLVIITFNFESAIVAKKMLPQLKTHWLVGYAKDKTTGKFPDLKQTIARAKAGHLDGLDLNLNWPLTKETVGEIKRAGLECHVWTVDDAAKAKELAKAGVDSITTNRPGWLREQLR